MKYITFLITLSFFWLILFFKVQAQNNSRYEIKLDSSRNKSIRVESLAVDLLLTAMTSDSVTVTIEETTGLKKKVDLPIQLFGKVHKFPFTSSTKWGVSISIDNAGYTVDKIDADPILDPPKVKIQDLLKRPWQLPLKVTIMHNNMTSIVTIYKNMAPTGSALFDAARLDSLKAAKDPALYDFINWYDKGSKGKDTKALLKEYFDERVRIKLTAVVSPAPGLATTASSLITLDTSVTRNPYLKTLIEDLIRDPTFPEPPASANIVSLTASAGETSQSKGSSLGALSNPMLAADAIATFIARRFKEEINVAFLNEFRQKLKIDTTLSLIFPRTKEIMLAIDPYEYTTFLESMKTAFEEDLGKLPANSATLLDTLVARKKIRLNRDRLALSRATLLTVQRTLDDRGAYWGALRDIKVADVADGSDTLKSVVLTGSLLINSILDTNDRVRLPNIKALPKDYADLLMGLLLTQQDTILQNIQTKFSNGTALVPGNFLSFALHQKTGDYNKFKDGATQFANSLLAFEMTLDKIKKKKEKDNNPEPNILGITTQPVKNIISYTDFALNLTTVLEQMLNTSKVFPSIPALHISQRILKPVRDGIQAFKHIQEKKYALGVVYVANMLVALTSKNDSTDSRSTVALKKYGTFMTSVVEAESRDQMLEALETAALPVGSYRIKRNNFFSVAINTYGGLSIGREHVREISAVSGTAQPLSKTSGWLFAPYAPLGISMAWGRNADYVDRKDHGSIGLHINLIDVGALAAVRLTNESVSLPEFTWKNLLAPGLQLIWGLPRSVLTLSGGVQLGPELRKINLDEGKNIIDTKQWRAGLTISADIPVFNVYTQANKRNLQTLRKSSLKEVAGKPLNGSLKKQSPKAKPES